MKPILFNTQMVQAILEGRKTTTRRVIKVDNNLDFIGCSSEDGCEFNRAAFGKGSFDKLLDAEIKERIKAPYMPEDIFYVREKWFEGDILNSNEDIVERNIVLYATDDLSKHDIEEMKWRPSIHMPRRLARIFLKVTDVRVEKLDQMIIADCLSEGIRAYTKDEKLYKYAVDEDQYTWQNMPRNPHQAFKDLWNSTLKKDQLNQYGWNANPWVWVIEFERCDKPNE